ncbi:hypothetical protein C7B61_08810 [filamentous cyanobacterium CCP1]|nr:hypothetical protein C7B61_08810 [filamentous cyanobacterium CCP1]
MAIFRQYIAPFLIVLVFLVALLAVSVRIFLPSDMAMPAPIEEIEQAPQASVSPTSGDIATPSLDVLVNGLPDDPMLGTSL